MTRHFTIELEFREAVSLTEGSSEGGGHESLDYIPGTSILGACVAALGISPADSLFAPTFLSEHTRFHNAYPALGGKRALPRPLTFRVGKSNPHCVIDSMTADGIAVPIDQQRAHFTSGRDTMKATRHAFISENDASLTVSAMRQEQVHVGIDRERRAAADGVLFTYQSLAAGSRFHGTIAAHTPEVIALLEKRTAQGPIELRLGRSRSAGYGFAIATLTSTPAGHPAPMAAIGARSVLTLLSDYLPALESAPLSALVAELAATLQIEPSSISPKATATRVVRGFRGVWGLPRPVRTALAKGSVLVVAAAIDPIRAASLCANGVGSRRNEGFGTIAVNWNVHGSKADGSNPAVRSSTTVSRLCRPSSPRGARHTALTTAITLRRNERNLRRAIDVALAHASTRRVAKAMTKIPPAQLGNLRAAMASSMTPTEIAIWFADSCGKSAGERWRRVNVPPLRRDDFLRNGVGFVCSSLFGASVDPDDKPAPATTNWLKAVEQSLCPLVDVALHSALLENYERAIRLFVIGLTGEITRTRNLDKKATEVTR